MLSLRINPDDQKNFWCPISKEEHKLHKLKKCKYKDTTRDLKLVYGICKRHNCLFAYVGETTGLVSNDDIQVSPYNLRPANSLKYYNFHNTKCPSCQVYAISKTTSGYNRSKNHEIIYSAIACKSCDAFFYYFGLGVFIAVHSNLTIKVNIKKKNNTLKKLREKKIWEKLREKIILEKNLS